MDVTKLREINISTWARLTKSREVYESEGTLMFEVYERLQKIVVSVCERDNRGIYFD